jgi:hypothetical protein
MLTHTVVDPSGRTVPEKGFLVPILVALLFLLFASEAGAACNGNRVVNIGGLASGGTTYADNFPVYPDTFIDLSRPARARVAISVINFRMNTFSASPFTVRFIAFKPSGSEYVARNVSATMSFTRSAASELYTAVLTPAVQFEAGDLLGATFYSASGGGVTSAESTQPSGYLIFHSDAPAGTHLARDSAARLLTAYRLQMEALATVDCSLAPPELFIVAVGDVTGSAHFVTDLTLVQSPRCCGGGGWPIHMTLRDRLSGSLVVATADSTSTIGVAYHPASLATALAVSPPYLGSLTLRFSDLFANTAEMAASARITANVAACSGGGTGASVDAVSCPGIGREIAIPFHLAPNQRMNVGAASAQLNSCGVFAPSTSVDVWVNSNTPRTIGMPGESMQLGDFTGAGGAQFGSVGMTDGVIHFRVTDEASRIVAYTSILDNTSQDSSTSLGMVLR